MKRRMGIYRNTIKELDVHMIVKARKPKIGKAPNCSQLKGWPKRTLLEDGNIPTENIALLALREMKGSL